MARHDFQSQGWREGVSLSERSGLCGAIAMITVAGPTALRAFEHGRVKLGVIVCLSAAGVALSVIVMRAAPMAAPVGATSAWSKSLTDHDCCDSSGPEVSSPELHSAADILADAGDTSSHDVSDSAAILI